MILQPGIADCIYSGQGILRRLLYGFSVCAVVDQFLLQFHNVCISPNDVGHSANAKADESAQTSQDNRRPAGPSKEGFLFYQGEHKQNYQCSELQRENIHVLTRQIDDSMSQNLSLRYFETFPIQCWHSPI